jgi:hypothetical protein
LQFCIFTAVDNICKKRKKEKNAVFLFFISGSGQLQPDQPGLRRFFLFLCIFATIFVRFLQFLRGFCNFFAIFASLVLGEFGIGRVWYRASWYWATWVLGDLGVGRLVGGRLVVGRVVGFIVLGELSLGNLSLGDLSAGELPLYQFDILKLDNMSCDNFPFGNLKFDIPTLYPIFVTRTVFTMKVLIFNTRAIFTLNYIPQHAYTKCCRLLPT